MRVMLVFIKTKDNDSKGFFEFMYLFTKTISCKNESS